MKQFEISIHIKTQGSDKPEVFKHFVSAPTLMHAEKMAETLTTVVVKAIPISENEY